MTAMMGLRTRMLLARLMVRISPDNPAQELGALTAELARGGANIVIIDRGWGHYPALSVIEACQANITSRMICGIAADAIAGLPATDLTLWYGPGPAPRLSRWSLTGGEGLAGLTDSDTDLVIVSPAQVAQAARIAPAAKPKTKPWFAAVTSKAEAQAAIDAGARRLVIDLTRGSESAGAISPVAEMVEAYRQLLAESWRTEMAAVSLGSFRPPVL